MHPSPNGIHQSSLPSAQSAAARRQVSLRGLFLSTTYFGVTSALAVHFGMGLFVLMNGLFLTWVSYRGYLWWMQSNRARPKLFGLSWLLFAISFGLPAFVTRGCGNAPAVTHYGWEAARLTVEPIGKAYEEASELLRHPEQRTPEKWINLGVDIPILVLWNAPNLMMLATPWFLYRQQRGQGGVTAALVQCAASISWFWGLSDSEDLRIGYYVWSGAVTFISLGRPPNRWTLVAIGGLLGLWLAIHIWSG